MSKKIGRNQPCPCGSGKKFKKCCGSFVRNVVPRPASMGDGRDMLDRIQAQERVREVQQGLGRPIISTKLGEHTFVTVGNTHHWAKDWKTFPDFLLYYIKRKLDPAWGNAEIAKPLADRHPIMQWYDALCRYQQAMIKTPGEVSSSEVTGLVACYMGLAYGLYLLDHNVELQDRLIRRLKDPANFQGAYYEIIVARILIRAGFTLALEDETDPQFKHCEFVAISKTGKKYWVEAKMRSIAGVLGRTTADGGADNKPIKKLIPHLNAAFAKPAADDRLIFVDLNTADGLVGDPELPRWKDAAIQRLEEYESKELAPGSSAYLFVTNIAYHLQLDRPPVCAVLPFGLGSDFQKPATLRLGDAYRRKQRHRDAYDILASFEQDTSYPETFDGSMPSEAFGGAARALIGETYLFEGVGGPEGTVATVTAATVNEETGEEYIAIAHQDGATSEIITRRMSPAELTDYKRHRDAYHGQVTNSRKKQLQTPLDLFEWLMEVYKTLPRDKLLANLGGYPQLTELHRLNDEDLRITYVEGLVANTVARFPPQDDR